MIVGFALLSTRLLSIACLVTLAASATRMGEAGSFWSVPKISVKALPGWSSPVRLSFSEALNAVGAGGSTMGRVLWPALKIVTPATEEIVGNPEGSTPSTSEARPAQPEAYGLFA